MTHDKFWHERWKKNEIGFHEPKPNPALVKHFDRLSLKKSARVFVPLCGKTLDIGWLISKGCRVAGAELSPIAIDQLFTQLRLKPQITRTKNLTCYRAKNIDIFVGDIFSLTRAQLGSVDAIYDRAALVALPPVVRRRYSAHLKRLTQNAPQLLVTFQYDQTLRPGPPFSIPNPELIQHYAKTYDIALINSAPLPGGLKGNVPAIESLWLLTPRLRVRQV